MKTTNFLPFFCTLFIFTCTPTQSNQEAIHPTVLDLLSNHVESMNKAIILKKKTVLMTISNKIITMPEFKTFETMSANPAQQTLSPTELKKKNKAYNALLNMLRQLINAHSLDDDNAYTATESGYLELLF